MTYITVQTVNSQLVVDSRLIAQELGITHKALKETARNYKEDLEELGTFAVTTAESNFGRPETFYYLNEDQATYLMTLSNNTPQVRAAKLQLVKAFRAAKDALQQAMVPAQPQLPSNYKEALLALVAAEEEKEQLLLQAAQQAEAIAEMQPKVKALDTLTNCDGWFTVDEAAKKVGKPNVGQKTLFKMLRFHGYLTSKNIPYQKYINSGHLKVITKNNGNLSWSQVMVSNKGLALIAQALV